jgi:hypothetical protein
MLQYVHVQQQQQLQLHIYKGMLAKPCANPRLSVLSAAGITRLSSHTQPY